jgi:hypothetical protein
MPVTWLVAEKPVTESKHQLRPGPADLHLLMGSWRPYDPPEGHPGLAGIHFRDSNAVDVSHLSFNFICLLLL